MAKKKRSSEANRLEEVGRSMHSTFFSAANSLSQIYTQAMTQQRLSFQAGERHALEKLYQWILRQHEETSRVTAADVVAYLQHEIDYGGEDTSMSPRHQAPHQHLPQSTMHNGNSSGSRAGHSIDQAKYSVFSNALSSPVRRTLQSLYPDNAENVSRNHEANSPPNESKEHPNSTDSSMDMHSDSPSHDAY